MAKDTLLHPPTEASISDQRPQTEPSRDGGEAVARLTAAHSGRTWAAPRAEIARWILALAVIGAAGGAMACWMADDLVGAMLCVAAAACCGSAGFWLDRNQPTPLPAVHPSPPRAEAPLPKKPK